MHSGIIIIINANTSNNLEVNADTVEFN